MFLNVFPPIAIVVIVAIDALNVYLKAQVVRQRGFYPNIGLRWTSQRLPLLYTQLH